MLGGVSIRSQARYSRPAGWRCCGQLPLLRKRLEMLAYPLLTAGAAMPGTCCSTANQRERGLRGGLDALASSLLDRRVEV